jgi:hypothetical protein
LTALRKSPYSGYPLDGIGEFHRLSFLASGVAHPFLNKRLIPPFYRTGRDWARTAARCVSTRWSAGRRRDKTTGSTTPETIMPKSLAVLLLAAFASASALYSDAETVLAQGAEPSLPGAPQPTPGFPAGPRLPGGPAGGSGNYAVSAAANDHASFLWVVDNVQHAVVLCEKTDGGRDFTCLKKPLP